MNGADALVKCLTEEGVDTVFGYPGVAICPFYNSILDSDIRTVLIRTEQNAAHAASGMARMTGKPGVCAVTSGPAPGSPDIGQPHGRDSEGCFQIYRCAPVLHPQ